MSIFLSIEFLQFHMIRARVPPTTCGKTFLWYASEIDPNEYRTEI